MVHYASLPASKLLRKDSSSRMSSASTASSSTAADSMWAVSGLSGGGFQVDYSGNSGVLDGAAADVRTSADASPSSADAAYFAFSDEQQAELLQEARANAAALVVDVLSDWDKWQFVAARGPLNVFELRADAAERVSSMVPPGAAPVAKHMHTMLGTTRVRARLDDFMRVFASARREAFQDVQTCLYEDRVQLADVFSSFGPPVGRRASTASEAGPQREDAVPEQYAVKYVSLKPVASKKLSASSNSASGALSSSSSSLKFGSSRGVRRRLRAAQQAEEEAPNTGITLCLGEYATIRRGKVRAAPSANSLAALGARSQTSNGALEDHRIGIISQHSLEDPAVTRYCKPVAISSASSASGAASPSSVLFAQRSLAQFSGIVVYPVASSTAGESLLEVLIKLSVYDPSPRGISHAMRLNMLAYMTAFQYLENALLVMRLRESPFLTSRNWVRSRSRKCCYICQAGFSSFRRKHHCRLCGEVTCSKCSDVHQIKLGRAGKCPFRICAQCVHGTDDAQRLQRRRGSSNESTAENMLSRSQTQVQPQGDDDDDDDEVDENDPSRRDQYAPPLKSSAVRNLAASARSSNGSTTSASSGSDFYDSRGLLATSAGPKAQTPTQSQSQTQSPRPPMNLTTLSVASTATTARSTTGSDLSPVRYQNESSTSSSPVSPGSAVLSEEDSDSFYARFSEMSLRDFHDSEFDLSLKGMPGMAGRPTGFEFDDSERGSDHELDDIGEEDDTYDAREIDIDAMPIPSPQYAQHQPSKPQADITDDESEYDFERESGMEFHDSEVGIEFDVSEIDIDGHLGNLIDEEIEEEDDIDDDDDEDIDEVIETSGSGERAVAPGHGSLAVIDQIRAARLAEYGILDSGKEHIYDVVAKQAAQHLDCALATVSFVDARREYVKAAFGASSSNSDIPKTHSLTAHIMRRCLLEDREVVVVGDARRDDLLSANMFVYEAPFIRFAVGVPVRAVSDGTILGALVVADPRPRGNELSQSQERMLRDLAEQVSALLEDRLARNLSAPGTGAAGPGQMREKLADLLSQSYHTGLQVQKNEHKILNSSGSSLSGSGSGSATLSASMLGGSSSGAGALSASMLGGPTPSRRFDPSGSAFSASSSAYNPSGSTFNPNGSRFDPSYSRIQPKFHANQSRTKSRVDDYGGMHGIEL